MLIDWFTVAAQAINFLILVWLLKRFLYQPILAAIDAREKAVARELADAAAKQTEAQQEHDEFQHKNEAFDRQRDALLAKATGDATAERERLLGEARAAASALSARLQDAVRTDAKNLDQAITRRAQEEVFATARKALADVASASLEERVVAVFTRRLHDMDGAAKARLGDALKANGEPALVRTAFDLPANQRGVVQNAVNETFSADIHLRFETSPDLVAGIELSANGQRVGWSIGEYLNSMQHAVDGALTQSDRQQAKVAVSAAPPAKRS